MLRKKNITWVLLETKQMHSPNQFCKYQQLSLKVYKDIFIGHNFWRKIEQTLDKDETFYSAFVDCLRSCAPQMDYTLKGYTYDCAYTL